MKKLILLFASVFLFKDSVQGQQIYPIQYFAKETLLHFYSFAFKHDAFHIVLEDSITSGLELPETEPPILILSQDIAFRKILAANIESFHTEDVLMTFKGKDTVDVCIVYRFTESLRFRGKKGGKRVDEIHVTYPIVCFDIDNRFLPVCRFIFNPNNAEWELIKLRHSLQ